MILTPNLTVWLPACGYVFLQFLLWCKIRIGRTYQLTTLPPCQECQVSFIRTGKVSDILIIISKLQHESYD